MILTTILQQNNRESMALIMIFIELKKHYESAQTKRTLTKLRKKAASDAKVYPGTQSRKISKADGNNKASDPPQYRSTKIDEMILILKALYLEHLRALDEIVSGPPTGGQDGDYHLIEFLRTTYNDNGQTLAWEEHRESVPLGEFYVPLSNGRRKAGVYGHCTRECRCCNMFHECYDPDARLPEIDYDSFKAVAG
ncbi:hypothetical protein CNMCM6106_006243 [Aspergillus hiratsukae]|uniref:Uncharacterized protein n=1 Tax=Aspergillus hiratsukae TaxID=1194566 RepID=A0A8H6QG61_9EURO|nr:hypothetical protein CNMCM6106_006243 [Aspergillus hiratsukae]